VNPVDRPWRDHSLLRALTADWRRRLKGRRVDGLGGGPGWLRLTLIDAREESIPPAQLFLAARPGASLLWDAPETPPAPVRNALLAVRQKELTATPHLLGSVLVDIAIPPEDRIVFFIFEHHESPRSMLAIQLFGPRGNIVLSDAQGRRIWSANPSPHSATLAPPAEDPGLATIPEADSAAAADIFRREAPRWLISSLAVDAVSRLTAEIGRVRVAASRLRNNLAADLEKAERGEEDRRRGETLAIHLHSLKRGPSLVELHDAAGEMIGIELDAALTPAENTDRYFHRARKAERGRDLIAERLAAAESRLAELAAATAAIDDLVAAHAGDDIALISALREWRAANSDLIGKTGRRRSRGSAAAAPVTALPYKRFLVEGKWEVWVGRGAKENDELTHKASSPRDLWLHAQGVSGSHVVLRSQGDPQQVPKRIIELAARIAAQYSKARNSGLAPVIYTERKYVRKPRKSPPGTASCIREKSLMVEPGIPDGTEQIG